MRVARIEDPLLVHRHAPRDRSAEAGIEDRARRSAGGIDGPPRDRAARCVRHQDEPPGRERVAEIAPALPGEVRGPRAGVAAVGAVAAGAAFGEEAGGRVDEGGVVLRRELGQPAQEGDRGRIERFDSPLDNLPHRPYPVLPI